MPCYAKNTEKENDRTGYNYFYGPMYSMAEFFKTSVENLEKSDPLSVPSRNKKKNKTGSKKGTALTFDYSENKDSDKEQKDKNFFQFHGNSPMQEHLVPIAFGELLPKDNMSVLRNDVRNTSRHIKILIDCCASASTIHDLFVCTNEFNNKKTSTKEWSTMAGSFLPSSKAEIKIKLRKLNATIHIFTPFHVTSQKSFTI